MITVLDCEVEWDHVLAVSLIDIFSLKKQLLKSVQTVCHNSIEYSDSCTVILTSSYRFHDL